MIRAACDSHPTGQNAITAQQTQTRIRKAARKAVPSSEGLQNRCCRKSRTCTPLIRILLFTRTALVPHASFCTRLLSPSRPRSELMPRLRKSGQLGMRANHGYATQAPCTTSPKWFATWPQVPSQSVLEYLRAGQVTLLAKTERKTQTFPHGVCFSADLLPQQLWWSIPILCEVP